MNSITTTDNVPLESTSSIPAVPKQDDLSLATALRESKPDHPRYLGNNEWFRAGFFAATGVAVLILIALGVMRLYGAALAIITPFAIAFALALLLDPLVSKLQKRGLKRGLAATTVFLGMLLLVIGLGALIVPNLIAQTSQFTERAPEYIGQLRTTTNTWLAAHPRILGFKMPRNYDTLTNQLSTQFSSVASTSSGRVTGFLLGSATMIIEAVVTLIVTFFLLLDIDRLRARLFYLLPKRARRPIDILSSDIGKVFAEYVRGLMLVSAMYSLATLLLLLTLSLFQKELMGYTLLIAILGGILFTIPYIGPLVTALITFLLAFAAGGVGFGGLAVGLTLLLNQVFDHVITPRIVGGGVGLHPVAAIFSLTLGGTLFGIWGMLLSVPIAASIQVVLFRLFPKLTTPTPPAFLHAQGVSVQESEPSKVMKGDHPQAMSPKP